MSYFRFLSQLEFEVMAIQESESVASRLFQSFFVDENSLMNEVNSGSTACLYTWNR